MECTQRLECTQELRYGSNYERICPEQIGFLGICGTKYPVIKGPNKIGRDPQMCNIVLNLNSISRQHAVVNILNNKEFMLMDLDSANKTKLLDKTLKPYIPHPLKNGDTVQFGDVFGIFRLLEEDDDLPMTQAIDIPDTPVPTRLLSRINTKTTIPESPDVSDKNDSLIISTQFNGGPQFKTPNERFIKPSSKTISIQPVGSNKIDNIFWNSSRKSNSLNFSLNNSRHSLNNSDTCINNKENNNIHEMETQVPYLNPTENVDSIFEAQTQIPCEDYPSEAIHNDETEIPTTEHLPEACKITEQCEMKLNLYTSTKEIVLDIHEAETQDIMQYENEKLKSDKNESIKETFSTNCSETKQNVSTDEELFFDDINTQSFQEDFDSQCLLPKVILSPKSNKEVLDNTNDENNIEKPIRKLKKRDIRLESESSTDCEDIDILPSQNISEIKIDDDDDETDCEDILNEINLIKSKTEDLAIAIRIKVNPGKIIAKSNNVKACHQNEVCFEDMLTQVVEIEGNNNNERLRDEVDFEDLPTQVIEEVMPNNSEYIEQTQQFSEEIISPFKVPLQSNTKIKNPSKFVSTLSLKSKPDVIETVSDKYYQATQDIYDDLCSQKVVSEKGIDKNDNLFKKPIDLEGVNITHSFQNDSTGIIFAHIENKTLKNSKIVSNCSKEDNEKVTKFVSSLSTEQIKEVIGINSASKLNRTSGESSEESTPKKLKPSRLMYIDLPNSQEIKANVHTVNKTLFTELSSDSESENNSEEQYTPILHHKKGQSKSNSKIHPTNKLNLNALPTRIITRVRKPTAIFADGKKKTEMNNKNILRPNYLSYQDDDIDKEIITENISRLKSKFEKNKSNQDSESHKKSMKNKAENSLKTVDKLESKDINDKNNTSKKMDNQFSNWLDTKKSKEIESENSDNKTKSNRSVRSSKTRHKTESENKLGYNSEIKKEMKTDNESQLTSNKNSSTTEPLSMGRITRNSKNKGKNDKNSNSPKLDEEKSKRKPSQKKRENYNSGDKVVEARRSTRQKTVKDKKENELQKPEIKSIMKRAKLNESTVTDTSSEFGKNSPRSLKRSALNDNDAPIPKRTRSSANSNNSCLRSTPARTLRVQSVLFTAFPSDEAKLQLENLGAAIVTDVLQCSVVLTMQIKRTFKLLCAVGLGRPIVGRNWVQACVDTKMIVDPWLYIIKDEAAEKRFGYNLEKTLRGKRNFLENYNVSSTPSVMPKESEMKLIVECSGGKWKEGGPRWICVSSMADKALWPSLKRRGAVIVTTEFILAGVLRQKMDIEANQFK